MITRKRKLGNKPEMFFSAFLGILFVGLFIGVIGFLIFSNVKINQKRNVMLSQISQLKNEVWELEQRNQELKQGISDTKKESYWEGKVREQGYKKPGEEQVVVLPMKNEPVETQEKKGFWQKFLEKLGVRE